MNARRRLVLLDYDGTLTNAPQVGVARTVREGLAHLARRATLVLATANSLPGIRAKCEFLDLFEYVIVNSGASVYPVGSRTAEYSTRMTVDLDRLLARNVPFAAQIDEHLLVAPTYTYTGFEPHLPIDASTSSGLMACDRLFLRHDWSVVRAAVHDATPTPLRRLSLRVPGVTVVQAREATKHAQGEAIRVALSIEAEDTYAAGNDAEDLGMLQWARTSYWRGSANGPASATRTSSVEELVEELLRIIG